MTQSGASYTAAVQINGYGGRVACSPTSNNPPPPQRLSLRVTGAVKAAAGGWLATSLVGLETVDTGWGCNGSTFSGWVVTHLAINGRAAG